MVSVARECRVVYEDVNADAKDFYELIEYLEKEEPDVIMSISPDRRSVELFADALDEWLSDIVCETTELERRNNKLFTIADAIMCTADPCSDTVKIKID